MIKREANITSIKQLLWFVLAIIHLCFSGYVLAATQTIQGIRVWPAPESTRVVFDLSAKPDYSNFTLKRPDRLVIDFKSTTNLVELSNVLNGDVRIKKIRTSKPRRQGETRIVLDLAENYQFTIFALAPAGQYGDRLVIDLYDKAKNEPITIAKANNQHRDIIIAIDAGHGGDDPGSIGAQGSYEKHVTLAIAKKLKALVDNEKGMKAVMTRRGDYYVDLNKRTEIARRNHADFLVSIHADAFSSPKPRGSSVWVVSDKRVETELAKWLINREKNSELLGGGGGVIKTTDNDNLAYTLADMNKDHSLEVSISTANNVIAQLRKITKMHKRVPQHASFAVLKASDIPSILVETGFISNYTEERLLNDQSHQQQLAHAIFNGIRHYFLEYPPKDTLFATMGYRKHRVVRGESLSVIAEQYRVSIAQLKSINGLQSNTLRVGQVLKIPRA
jgi:N-acetylmuramoyl-L-alanine amidase